MIDAPGNTPTAIATGEGSGPWTGVTFHAGNFYVADVNVRRGGRVLRIAPDGESHELITGLPSLGDHHTGFFVTEVTEEKTESTEGHGWAGDSLRAQIESERTRKAAEDGRGPREPNRRVLVLVPVGHL